MGRSSGTKTGTVARLEEHPNLVEVLGVLAQLAHIADDHLIRLAGAWQHTVPVAQARDRALTTDSPLVCEVLAAFDAVGALFADDLRGEASYLVVGPEITLVALTAVRDAVAAAYARPSLSAGDHALLMRPWRSVFPRPTVQEPDLGPRGDQVKVLLGALPQLAGRCHDVGGQALFDALVDRSFADESGRADALETAFQAAVLTSRRRVWALVRRSGAEGLCRPCPSCRRAARTPEDEREHQRVLTLCLDAACALLVADTLPDVLTDALVAPVSTLIPLQRRPGPSS